MSTGAYVSFEKKDGKYIDDRIQSFLEYYEKGKPKVTACGLAGIDENTIDKYVNMRQELSHKKEEELSQKDKEILVFVGDFARARAKGQSTWLKPIEDYKDNPEKSCREGSAKISISMLKLLYVEFRDDYNKEKENSTSNVDLIVDDMKGK